MENKCFLQKLGINVPNGGVPLGQMRIKITDVNANVVNIYELLNRVVNGTESFHVIAEYENPAFLGRY